jgi:hypothetical protein
VSIIYEALQKTQNNRSIEPKAKLKNSFRHVKWFDMGMLMIIILLFTIVLYAYFPYLKKAFTHTQAKPNLAKTVPAMTKKNVASKTTPTLFATGKSGNIILNGVFLSDQDNFAMINNQALHVGDIIEGMTITKIEFDKVQLHDEKMNLILRSAV